MASTAIDKIVIDFLHLNQLTSDEDIRCEKIKQGKANDVWAIKLNNNWKYILKSFRKEEAFKRELLSYKFLSTSNFPHSQIIFSGQGSILFNLDECLATRENVDTSDLGKVANYLGRLHNLNISEYDSSMLNSDIQPNQILEYAKHEEGYVPSNICFVHGDVWGGNCVFAGSDLLYFIDFEESGVSDPLIDLTIALIECCWVGRSYENGKVAAEIFKEEYFKITRFSQESIDSFNNDQEKLLLNSTLKILRNWALKNNCSEVFEKYSGLSF